MLSDALAHTLNKMEHLATVHYENGHYHLHNELKALDESETQKKNPSENSTLTKAKVSDSEQLFFKQNFSFQNPSEKISLSIPIALALLSGFKKIPYTPPKVA
jgi:hypothetical protein